MKGRFTAILLAILMATMSMTGTTIAEDSGRQMDDVDCSGYTFEDLFDYNFALFDIDIGGDWATASMGATAYVNGSNPLRPAPALGQTHLIGTES